MSEYKCEDHKLDIVCIGCVIAGNRRYKKLLEFTKLMANYKCCITFACFAKQAEELLEKIGEDK